MTSSAIQVRAQEGRYDMSSFTPGDRVRTRHAYWHEGIYVGPLGPDGESIVHNDFDAKQVILSHPEGYTRKGRSIQLAERTPPEDRALVVERAMEMLGRKFDLVRFNCQHVAHYAQHSIAYSPRIRKSAAALGITALLAAGVLIIWSGRKGKK